MTEIAPEIVEKVARMIARGLGHNDETGIHWERYVRAAEIIVREFRSNLVATGATPAMVYVVKSKYKDLLNEPGRTGS